MKYLIKFTGGSIFIAIAIGLLGIGGWVANIVKFIGLIEGPVTAMFIARIVGIPVGPLGAILGYF